MKRQPEASNGPMVRTVSGILGFALLVGIMMALGFWLLPDPPPPRAHPVLTDADRRYVTARMKFHGIEHAELDEATGERYFWRDGERCRL